MFHSRGKSAASRYWVFIGILALTPAVVRGEDSGQMDRPEDRQAIGKRARGFLEALTQGDATKVAAFWTASGEYMRGDILTIRGRENIARAYAEHLKKKFSAIEIQSSALRFLSEDSAIQSGTFVVKKPNPADQTRSKFSVLYVREKGQWYFALLRESAEEPSLEELGWLAGTWTFKSGEAETRLTFQWTENHRYLSSRVTMKTAEGTVTGLQILAIDPATGGIKSWTFESDGSLGSAVWVRTDKGWAAEATTVTASGEKARSINLLTPIDENSFQFEVTQRTIDDVKAPSIGPIKVSRLSANEP